LFRNLIVLKYVVKFLLLNNEKTLEFLDFQNEFLKLLDEPKLSRKLLFSLIGKEKGLTNLMSDAFSLDFRNRNFESLIDYIMIIFDLMEKKIESSYCVLFILTNLFTSLKKIKDFQKKTDVFEPKKLEKFDKILKISCKIINKHDSSTVAILISKLIKTIVFEISLSYLNLASDCNLNEKVKVFFMIQKSLNGENRRLFRLEAKVKKESLSIEHPNISSSEFFNEMFNKKENDNFKTLCLCLIKEEGIDFKIFIKILRGILKSKWLLEKKEISLFHEYFLQNINKAFHDKDKTIKYFNIMDKILIAKEKEEFFNEILENIINSLFMKLQQLEKIEKIENNVEFDEIENDLKLIKIIQKHTKLFKNTNFKINFKKELLENVRNEKTDVNIGKILIFNTKLIKNLRFSLVTNEEMVQFLTKIQQFDLQILYSLTKFLILSEETKSMNKIFPKIIDFIEKIEITTEKQFKMICHLTYYLSETKEQYDLLSTIEKMCIFIKSFKTKELEEKKVLDYFLLFLQKLSIKKIPEDAIILRVKQILKEVMFIHSKICEKVAIFLITSPKLIVYLEELVTFLFLHY